MRDVGGGGDVGGVRDVGGVSDVGGVRDVGGGDAINIVDWQGAEIFR